MRLPPASLVLVFLAGCATSGGVAGLADGRRGRFPILTAPFPTVPGAVEQPATVTGDLSLPGGGSGRVPAVIVLHSCAGVQSPITQWARELNRMGYAALVVDSFTGRGVTEVCTGHTPVSIGSRLADVFRAQELLATHPAIDPQHIGVVGFSHGGSVVLWASQAQYPRRFMRGSVRPAGCAMFQQADGTFTDEAGKRFSGASPCMTRGASMGYDARAHQQSIADLKTFFDQTFAPR